MPLDLPAFSINPAAVKVVDAACRLVDGGVGNFRQTMVDWDALVKAVANYRTSPDPNAAKRNRDEHGPDIPTQDLDWRSRQ
jgi:hypothetical protein